MTDAPQNQARHLTALAAGAVAMATVVWAPTGVIGSLLMVAVAVSSLLFAVEASRRPGVLRWLAIVGGLLAGLSAITAAGILAVAFANLFS